MPHRSLSAVPASILETPTGRGCNRAWFLESELAGPVHSPESVSGRSGPTAKTERENVMRKYNTASLVGAGAGLVVFFTTALLPSLVYGGYAGLLLAGGIFGTPVEPTVLARGLVAFGMILGVVAVASILAVGGAALGALVGSLFATATEATRVPTPGTAVAKK